MRVDLALDGALAAYAATAVCRTDVPRRRRHRRVGVLRLMKIAVRDVLGLVPRIGRGGTTTDPFNFKTARARSDPRDAQSARCHDALVRRGHGARHRRAAAGRRAHAHGCRKRHGGSLRRKQKRTPPPSTHRKHQKAQLDPPRWRQCETIRADTDVTGVTTQCHRPPGMKKRRRSQIRAGSRVGDGRGPSGDVFSAGARCAGSFRPGARVNELPPDDVHVIRVAVVMERRCGARQGHPGRDDGLEASLRGPRARPPARTAARRGVSRQLRALWGAGAVPDKPQVRADVTGTTSETAHSTPNSPRPRASGRSTESTYSPKGTNRAARGSGSRCATPTSTERARPKFGDPVPGRPPPRHGGPRCDGALVEARGRIHGGRRRVLSVGPGVEHRGLNVVDATAAACSLPHRPGAWPGSAAGRGARRRRAGRGPREDCWTGQLRPPRHETAPSAADRASVRRPRSAAARCAETARPPQAPLEWTRTCRLIQ